MKPTFHITTLGCPKNVVDSENMTAILETAGFKKADDPAGAKVIIVNTCCFIEPAREEAINTILEAADLKEQTGGFLVVAGCMPQRYKDEIADEIPEVDAWMGLEDLGRMPEVVSLAIAGKNPRIFQNQPPKTYPDLPYATSTPAHYAYLKIAEGCSHRCSFCVIPGIRGDYRSASIEAAEKRAGELVASGRGEIVLIAQDTTRYGEDIYGRKALPELLERLASIEGLKWLRLMYAYPTTLTDEILTTMARKSNICKYVDVPLQHSHPAVLKKMGRPFKEEFTRGVVERIKTAMPGAAIRTAFITGHPGETEKRFLHLVDFIREMEFYHVGVFTYSPEEGTPSAHYKTRPPHMEAVKRRDYLMQVQQDIARKLRKRMEGKIIPAVCEEIVDTAKTGEDQVFIDVEGDAITGISSIPVGTVALGRTIYDAPEIDGLLFIKGDAPPPGKFFKARIIEECTYDFTAEAADEQY